jgi:hypothetical protein
MAFGISPSSFLIAWPINLNFLFLISKFISSCPVTLHKSYLLEIIFGHHILRIYLKHRLTKVCTLRWISLVTSHVSYPCERTGSHPASCTMGKGSFPGVERPGRGANHPTPPSASRPLVACIGWSLPFIYTYTYVYTRARNNHHID